MAFMVISFSMLPCADAEETTMKEGSCEFRSTQQHTDQQHDDACSPFCTCSCCAVFSVVAIFPSAAALKPLFQSINGTHLSERLYNIVLPIWQPPQLG